MVCLFLPGQPYNQLAILEAAKGSKLSTVFFYLRSVAVKHPFPVAATNLEKLYAKLARDSQHGAGSGVKGSKLTMNELVTVFLQFHALVHQSSGESHTLHHTLRGIKSAMAREHVASI
jgi:protein SMG7